MILGSPKQQNTYWQWTKVQPPSVPGLERKTLLVSANNDLFLGRSWVQGQFIKWYILVVMDTSRL